jgi:uncharacterized protein YcbK (DUF882 family)
VREFVCRDGSDTVKVDTELVALLQQIRDHFNRPVTVVSGYRSKKYNTAISGAKSSQHLYGKAADISINRIKPRTIAEYAETLCPGGMGLYEYGGTSGFVHIDTRAKRARWLQASPNGGSVSVSGFDPNSRPTVKKGSTGETVKELQGLLNALGFACGEADGIFGKKTLSAVKAFQKAKGLTADGIACTGRVLSSFVGSETVSSVDAQHTQNKRTKKTETKALSNHLFPAKIINNRLFYKLMPRLVRMNTILAQIIKIVSALKKYRGNINYRGMSKLSQAHDLHVVTFVPTVDIQHRAMQPLENIFAIQPL